MKVIHLDLETTGLDWNTCHVVSVAMVADDTNNRMPLEELPKFYKKLRRHSYSGEPRALAMHRQLFDDIANNTPDVIFHSEIASEMAQWLCNLNWGDKFNICGKNVAGFDFNFLALRTVSDHCYNCFSRQGASIYIRDSLQQKYQFRGRVIDIGTLYADFDDDESIPSTQQCIDRSGLKIEGSVHDALDDCMISVKLLRRHIDYTKQLRGGL